MNYTKLSEIQAGLDFHIEKEKGLEGKDLMLHKVVALITEIGELMNEFRAWKFWSNDQEIRRDKMIVEYVDGLHFILSIANDLGVNEYEYKRPNDSEIKLLVIGITNLATTIHLTKKIDSLLNHYLLLGEKLGLSLENIEAAYLEKNKINHERQLNGY